MKNEYDKVYSPWIGCEEVDEGCENCPVERMIKIYGHPKGERTYLPHNNWNQILRLHKKLSQMRGNIGHKHRVLSIGSYMDFFEDIPKYKAIRTRLLSKLVKLNLITWLIPTKRPENILKMLPANLPVSHNIVIGVSICDQKSYDRALPYLKELQGKGWKTYLLMTPLLGEVNMDQSGYVPDWIVVGGEVTYFSNADVRPLSMRNLQGVLIYCRENVIPVWVRSLGAAVEGNKGRNAESLKHLVIRDRPQFENWIKEQDL